MDKDKMVVDEEALNSAGWVFAEKFRNLMQEQNVECNQRNGWWFNNIKQIIRPVIQNYLEKINETKEDGN